MKSVISRRMNPSARSRNLNMTAGHPLKLLIVFAVPMLAGNLFQQVYNLADSIIVGRMVGSGALAAVGATNSVTFLVWAIWWTSCLSWLISASFCLLRYLTRNRSNAVNAKR